MKKIDELDLNMAVSTRLNDPEIEWLDVHDAPFSLHGFSEPQPKGEPFRRLPKSVAEATSEGVAALSLNTAGGRVRFKTDSPFVAIHAEMENVCHMDHMAFTGIFGFDLYERIGNAETYIGTFRPSAGMTGGFESRLALRGEAPHEVTVNFPLYNGVDRLFIGVQQHSAIAAPRPYAQPLPVVYYGSSITQGGCASRPGNSYQAMISRMLDCDHVNLGFSGNAKGEAAIVRYMATLPMSVFVCDYDHNAPTPEHLQQTHLPLYRAIRNAQPELPIILISKPDHQYEPETATRREIILNTYRTALAEGDRNIAFIDGATLFEGDMADSCTVDTSHPNDLGFYRMAQKIGAVIQLMPQLRRVREQFSKAAKAFGFRFTSPYILDPTTNLAAFGCVSRENPPQTHVIELLSHPTPGVRQWCEDHKMHLSLLNIEPLLEEYDPAYFEEMLEDWEGDA